MADYAKISVRAVHSENSDYSDPLSDTKQVKSILTPTESVFSSRVLIATTPGITPDIDLLSAGAQVVIQNLDSSIDCVATWDDSDGNSNTQRIPAGAILVLPDVDATSTALTIYSDSGTPEVLIWGAG